MNERQQQEYAHTSVVSHRSLSLALSPSYVVCVWRVWVV